MNTSENRYAMSPLHLYFVLYVSFVGAGLMNFQHNMLRGAANDGWISILAAAAIIGLIIKMMFVLLGRQSPDRSSLVHINRRYWGSYLGAFINWMFILYFIMGALVTFQTYVHIIQLWVLPMQNAWMLGLVILILIYYCVSGGIRSVAGICLWGTLFILIFVFPQTFMVASYLHPRNLLPVLDHDAGALWVSTRQMLHEFIGCGILLVIYPYVKSPERSVKWAYSALFTATAVYLVFFVLAYMFFSPGQMKEHLWPTLSLISIIELPLIQRMEYLALSLWLLKMLSIIALSLWASCRCMKLQSAIRPSLGLKAMILLFVTMLFVVKDTVMLEKLTAWYDLTGEMLILMYVPLLFLVSLIRRSDRDRPRQGEPLHPGKGEGV
ncbi:GerAB/ArcD/ProY family transporter [Paenibacillus sp. JJ-223]|uniref:GerAB/ArcD/ProY family transporter n=1 Tax=Paenibacillus sp. JJ-223 TaxID=2905647 RepID=UPI001F393AD7|nr:GerAB/ArcD/ProY family transporter [Paenibacillus sp. JJ-223]CAH1204934.1 hypothetical protein PAECIP111890_02568 [Paenibacillus sp. JJ-223]